MPDVRQVLTMTCVAAAGLAAVAVAAPQKPMRQAVWSQKTVPMLSVLRFRGSDIFVADNAAGLNARSVKASTVPLPAQAGPASQANFIPVLAADNRTHWVSSSDIVVSEDDVGGRPPTRVLCNDTYFAVRGLESCQK